MIYLPVLKTRAELISGILQELAMPLQIRPANYKTTNYCKHIDHPDPMNPIALLVLNESDKIRLNSDPDLIRDKMTAIYQPAVDQNLISASIIEETRNAIAQNAGQEISILDFMPDFWKQQIMSDAQALEQGFLQTDGRS